MQTQRVASNSNNKRERQQQQQQQQIPFAADKIKKTPTLGKKSNRYKYRYIGRDTRQRPREQWEERGKEQTHTLGTEVESGEQRAQR